MLCQVLPTLYCFIHDLQVSLAWYLALASLSPCVFSRQSVYQGSCLGHGNCDSTVFISFSKKSVKKPEQHWCRVAENWGVEH